MIDRWTAANAVHGLGNELTSILCLAEMVEEGSEEARELLVADILDRSSVIRVQLDTLVAFVSNRRMHTHPAAKIVPHRHHAPVHGVSAGRV